MTDSKPLVSIIIVNFNTKVLLDQCIKSIYSSKCKYSLEIIVVDNASVDGSVKMLKNSFQDIIIIENKQNLGFSKANNAGIQNAIGKYILFLNSDTIILENTLNTLLEFLENNNNITAVGPKLLNFDKTLQRSWFDFPTPLKTFLNLTGFSFYLVKLKNNRLLKFLLKNSNKIPAFMLDEISEARQIDYLTLACLLMRKDALIIIGNLDENIFFYHEDCELGYKLKSFEMKTFYLPTAIVIHLGGSSSQKNVIAAFENFYINLIYVFKKYESRIKSIQMKTLILIGLVYRSFFWFFGFYRNINMFSVYSENPTKNDIYKPKGIDAIGIYRKLIFILLFNKSRQQKF